jgi:hypothetical protein
VARRPWLGCGWPDGGATSGAANWTGSGALRYVVRSSGWTRRQRVLSFSMCWGGSRNVTRCFSALMETEARFSALVETETQFSALMGLSRALVETGAQFSALLETYDCFSALVETATSFCSLMDTEICFLVRLLPHFRFLGGRLTFDDGACGGGGGCDASSTATCAASALSGMGG